MLNCLAFSSSIDDVWLRLCFALIRVEHRRIIMKSSIYAKSLSIWVTNFLLCLSLLASLSEVAQSEEDGEIASLQQAEKRLTSLCRDISSITNLKTMQQLIDSLKTVSSKRLEIKRTNSWSFFNYDRMVPCLDNANSIIELEPLIS